MNILLTNDDGIHAKGLKYLCEAFSQKHEITIIAPDRERSAASHAITLNEPLRVFKMGAFNCAFSYAVNGTPADCIKLGLLELMKKKPDMVISGINPGANVGVNINYSGTVAAAREASLSGITSLAVSIHGYDPDHYKEAAMFTVTLAEETYERKLPFGTFLNVNIPNIPINCIEGIAICKQNISIVSECFEKKTDPRNRIYYWQKSDQQGFLQNIDIDGSAIEQKYISITPIKCDLTDYCELERIKKWDIVKQNG